MAKAAKKIQEPEAPKMGRPLKPDALSKNPEWSKKTIYVRERNVLDATYRLKSRKDGRTLSELIDELLIGWNKANPK